MYWALFFLIIGIRDVIDAKPLLKNKDIYSLNEQVRKKYRRRRGISYLLCSAIAGCIFAYERMNGTGIERVIVSLRTERNGMKNNFGHGAGCCKDHRTDPAGKRTDHEKYRSIGKSGW